MGQTLMDATIPTACTNGLDKRYSPAFVATLTDKQLRLLVLHENLHVSYRHMTVWRPLWKQDARRANIAADHFVNLSLVDSDAGEGWLEMPTVGVMPEPKYRGWSVQMIFDDLGGDHPDDPDGGSGDGDGGGFDQHDWQAAQQMTEAEQNQLAEDVDRALRQGQMVAQARGLGKGGSALAVDDLLAPKVDWRRQLAEFVQDTCMGRDESTWRRPNRRYLADDVYMPSMEATSMGELVVALDTSGSCFSGTVISRFASELAAIVERVRPSKVRVLYVDMEVHGEQVFEGGTFALTALKPEGGGGTDMTQVFKYISAKRYTPQAVVILTDGETPYGTAPAYPVLWAITEKNIKAPYGRTIHLTI
jgi:predicted metal-dependent peptidase